ncbi:MAG TPA: SMC-Scp complex subunit ScpB [Candidatus Atribacteria bacterium]|nr:SMC-Scp complex subunit ScpB [Candidatus Atribacteria bacterium]HPT77913.1 SMC-Scp complex subunit ScpB [Candidatus Atribacteria bacterium]
MDERDMMAIAESILFVSGEPVELKDLADLLGIDQRKAKKLMESMTDCFNFERRGLQIIALNGKYQLATRPEHSEHIEKFIGQERGQTLSQAALETLAIIAYKQPITKSEVDAIRGVKSDHTISVLINRGYICETGRKDSPGRPILYGTTDLFLRNFGLNSLKDLPPIDNNR